MILNTRMEIKLTLQEKACLEVRHQSERDAHARDRIKSILLRDENWGVTKIAQALRLSNDTVSRYLNEYLKTKSVDTNYPDSSEKLSIEQSELLQQHLREHLHTKAVDIVAYIKEKFGIDYTVAGVTDWLKRHDFSYKWTKGQPEKADTDKQAQFVSDYEELKEKTPKNEPIFFIDGVHPTMATKSTRGWIAKGIDKVIPMTASRTRMNIMGAIELSTMGVFHSEHETINASSVIELFSQLKRAYPTAKKLHIILDQAGYHRSEELAAYTKANNIQLHFLPSYSPNLNPIERLWKVMNEQVRNNRYFKSAKEFRESIREFFARIPEMIALLKLRITDNFRVVNAADWFFMSIYGDCTE